MTSTHPPTPSYSAEQMENGEWRFRLNTEAGSGYALTRRDSTAAWQRSHRHEAIKEVYAVEAGLLILARLVGNQVEYELLRPGDTAVVVAGVAHNAWLSPGAVTHTIKMIIGTPAEANWSAVPLLDRLIEEGPYHRPEIVALERSD